jgi:hypothetical protein
MLIIFSEIVNKYGQPKGIEYEWGDALYIKSNNLDNGNN